MVALPRKLCKFAKLLENCYQLKKNYTMKKILLLFVLATISTGLFAQSLSLSDEHGPIAAGATILVVGDPADPTIVAHIDCKNIGSAALDVKVFRRVVNVLPGSSSYFCWGACFSPTTDTSLTQITLQPDETTSEFSGDYEPKEQVGSSFISYVFYDKNNMADSVSVTVEFKASPAGIEDELASKINFSNAYPNPANKVAYFDYAMPAEVNQAKLIVSNLLGAVVETVNITANDNRIELNTNNLKNGLYICSLEVQNSVVMTKKLVVNH